ncbi:MAG TPA: FAD-binding protein [Candidatus Caccoplasma merdavium]|nr:FAD-binding protein [Candidatus Caccoplasma merdavium]
MVKEISIRILPQQAATENGIKDFLGREYALNKNEIQAVRILKRSIDARKRQVFINLTVRIYINEQPQDDLFTPISYGDVSDRQPAVVVGAGPAGLFAALRLIELGMRPIVLERGQDVHQRRKDIARISREHIVDNESNYCFGEGGAGAFSDGKLYTRSKKRGSVERILSILCQHGASPAILSDAHPHIGTDKLPLVIENIRHTILRSGGEVRFGTRVDELIFDNQKVIGVKSHDGNIFYGPVILATGHSARDIYYYLHTHDIALEAKGFAVGVRLEHPQELIDRIQYHNPAGRGRYLPAAEYSFVTQVDGRGVYSFCMCPGGFVVPAASGQNQLVVNGMSPSNRGSRWANSGMVVEIRPEDLPGYETGDVLAGIKFQEEIERQCFVNGNCRQTAPAQRMTDFVHGKISADLPSSSYAPGVLSSPLHFWMPEFITRRLRQGFLHFGQISHGFLTREALMIGVETRTSSPVRIPRDNESLNHIGLEGLYPCGEGAGYAGGIVSAAIDGERCAEALAQKYQSHN